MGGRLLQWFPLRKFFLTSDEFLWVRFSALVLTG